MIQPQPSQLVTRRYFADDHYTTDAASMVAAGWRVVSIQREPNGAIVASYTPITAQSPSPRSTPTLDQMHVSDQIQRRALLFVGALISGLVLLAILAGVISAAVSPQTSVQQGTPSNAQATNAAFAASLDATATADASSATSTPAPVRVEGAQLGGPLDAFDVTYGTEQGSDTWYTSLDGQQVMIFADPNSTTNGQITTPDGSVRAWSISVTYLESPPPSAAQNAVICKKFMPSDAQRLSVNSSASPTEYIYRSQQLASSFNANAFENNAGADVMPGTFDVVYSAMTCDMTTGQS